MKIQNIIVLAVLALLAVGAFAQATIDSDSSTESTPSAPEDTPPATEGPGSTDPSIPEPTPDTDTTDDGTSHCQTNSDGSTACLIHPNPEPGPNCDGPIGMDPNGNIFCDTPNGPPAGQTVPPQPNDDDTDPDTDTDDGSSSSSSSGGSSGSSTGSGSSGAGGKPYVCNGVGYKLEEGMVCTGKETESVFEGTCCSVPGTAPQAAVQEPVETAPEPVIEIPAEPEELVSSLPAGEVAALPNDGTETTASPGTGFAGLLGNPQAVGLGFIILAVLLLAGYWYSEQQKK